MAKNQIVASPDGSICKVRETMKKNDISQIQIVDKNSNIIRIMKEKNILDNPKGDICSDSMGYK